jgi:signal transduction histidine kinase
VDAERTLQVLLRSLEQIARAGLPAEACVSALGAVEALGVSGAWIQWNDAAGTPRFAHTRDASPGCLTAAGRGLPWPEAAATPGIVVIEAGAGPPEALPGALHAAGMGAATLVPIVSGSRLLGALVLLTEERREWTAGERRLANGIAQLAAGALEMEREFSARLQLEQELVQAQRLESIGRIAGGVAHDFNNMLTAMIGYMDLVSACLPPDTEEQGYLAQALDAAEQATDLSRQILSFARRQPAPPAPQNLNALLEQLRPLVQRLLPDSVRLVTRAHADPVWVLADAGQIEQLAVSLALRARDAMPEGGVMSLTTTIVAGAKGAPDRAALEAEDTGGGMDADALRLAMQPTLGGAGKGGSRVLELAIAAALVRASGGQMEAERLATGGTRVRASWPLTVSPGSRPDPGGAVVGGRETVLFVEDDPMVRDLAATTLSRLGYEVLTAPGADEALGWLEQHPGGVQLLIADLVLPGMSGRELVLRARETRPGLCVLLTSGYATSPGVTEVAGGLPFLPKPFTSDTLARRVRETLDAPPGGPGGAPA